MTSIVITQNTLNSEELYTKAIERLERYNGREIDEVVLKKMVLTVKKWKE